MLNKAREAIYNPKLYMGMGIIVLKNIILKTL